MAQLIGGIHFHLNILKAVIWERTIFLIQTFARLDVLTSVSPLGSF